VRTVLLLILSGYRKFFHRGSRRRGLPGLLGPHSRGDSKFGVARCDWFRPSFAVILGIAADTIPSVFQMDKRAIIGIASIWC
jgi:hypothetical protein